MYVDMHSHVIWDVDDGAERREETLRMLREASADGIGAIICTPHMTPGVYSFPEEKFQAHFLEAQNMAWREQLPLALFPGAEVLYTDHVPRLLREGRIPTLASSSYVLVEFSPTDEWSHIYDALKAVSSTGYRPVIAHMERYPAIRTLEQVRKLKTSFQARVQINARSLLRKQPLFRRRFFNALFTENLVDFVATDTHALPGRETCMKQGMQALRERFGDTICSRIQLNAEELLRR